MKSTKLWMITDSSLCQTTEAGAIAETRLLKYCWANWDMLDALVIREAHWSKLQVANFIAQLPPKNDIRPHVILNWPMSYEPWDLPIDGIHLNGRAARYYVSNEGRCDALQQVIHRKKWHLGLSIHCVEEWDAFKGLEPSYVMVSNVYETGCKPGKLGLGIEGTKALTSAIRLEHPQMVCIGLGGLKRSDEPQMQTMGLNGLALRSEFHKD